MHINGSVVLGLGSVDGGRRELEWAAREAELRNRPLVIVRAVLLTDLLGPAEKPIGHDVYHRQLAVERGRVETALAYVAAAWPSVRAEAVTPDSTPDKARTELSRYADLVVVGSHARSTLGSIVLGSVSGIVVATAHCPVVAVGASPPGPTETRAVVAGVDGSTVTDEVLAFAFDYASRHQRDLNIVLCWAPDLLATLNWLLELPPPQRAERWLAEMTAGWCGKYPDIAVRASVVRGRPVSGLVEASASGELLVVGAHSRLGVVGALLGSVSQGVLHHARCPVAVIHPAE